MDTVLAAFEEIIAQTGARARELFLELIPQGEWRFHDFLDSDGGTEARPYRIDLTLARRGGRRAAGPFPHDLAPAGRGGHVPPGGPALGGQARGPINFPPNAGLL